MNHELKIRVKYEEDPKINQELIHDLEKKIRSRAHVVIHIRPRMKLRNLKQRAAGEEDLVTN